MDRHTNATPFHDLHARTLTLNHKPRNLQGGAGAGAVRDGHVTSPAPLDILQPLPRPPPRR